MKIARSYRRTLACLSAALLVALAAMPARADAKLRWKFEKGKKYSYVVTQKTGGQGGPQGQKIEQTQVMDMTWEVKGVEPDGTADMVQTIDRIQYKLEGPVSVSFDSKEGKDPSGPLAAAGPLFRALVGAAVELKMSPRGQISDVKLPKQMVDALKNAGPAGSPFTEEGMKNMISQATLLLPEEAVANGKSWTDAKSVESPLGTMALNSTYTYQGPTTHDGKMVEKIGVDINVDIKPKPDAPFQASLTSQDNKGSFFFDNKGGYLMGSEITQKMKMALKVQGQEVVQDIESTMTMEQSKGGASPTR
jgi:hypothetical protein